MKHMKSNKMPDCFRTNVPEMNFHPTFLAHPPIKENNAGRQDTVVQLLGQRERRYPTYHRASSVAVKMGNVLKKYFF